ncbi:MAG: decaprenyl-phosphate phosphoribosyltransferase [Chromatiales bacterium]|nr:decaprenyl-phosphate phosphoribosyltransferase [Chromatiales bacterium]
MNHPLQFLKLMRPHQWLKNGFVLVGPFFAHAWGTPGVVSSVLLALIAFCLIASAIYVVNDLADVEADRLHPTKRLRPLAAGTVSNGGAVWLAIILFVVGMAAAWFASPMVALIVLAYLFLNLAYTWRLKQVVILDVFIIAAGFMLRILAGTTGIGIEPSSWLLLTGLMVTLLLGFSKRRSELAVMERSGEMTRSVLQSYSLPMLDLMIGVCTAGVVMAYSLYTMSSETIAIHQTDNLIYTVPFVLYGMFRYLYRTFVDNLGEDPARDILRDPHLLVTLVGWVVTTLWLFQ